MGLTNTLVFSMKMFTISVVVVSLAVGIKSSVPIALNRFPIIWSIILSWSKPPFLYLVINGIILTIAASSRFFHHDNSQTSNVLSEPLVSAVETSLPADLAVISPQLDISPAALVVYDQLEERLEELKSIMVKDSEVSSKTEREDGIVEVEGEEVFPGPKLVHNTASAEIISTQLQVEHSLQVMEKPLVSSRFGHRNWKPIRSGTPEGANALRVARPKRQETVENSWKAITEGCHVPLRRHHHKKHDPPKSDTFKGRAKFDPSSYRIRREPSLSRDELNDRVEAFIKKFNEDMRLQRQQSLQQYMEMIHRGA